MREGVPRSGPPGSNVQLELLLADPHVVAGLEAGLGQGGDHADLGQPLLKVGERFFVARIVAFEEHLDAAAADPEASIAAGKAVNPDLDHDLWLGQLKAGLALMPSPRGPGEGIGWMSTQDWDDTVALMRQYQDLKTDKTGSAFFTTVFLPK